MNFRTISKVSEQLRMGWQVSQMYWWSVLRLFEIGTEQTIPTDKNLKDWGRANAGAALRKLSVGRHILLWTFSLLWSGELTREVCSNILDTPFIIDCAHIEMFTVVLWGYWQWLKLNAGHYTCTPNTGPLMRVIFIPPVVISHRIKLIKVCDCNDNQSES